MRPEIDLQAFAAAHADGAFVVDVREPGEYVGGHVPGALLIPLAQVLARKAELPANERVFVICASGNRSKSATDWLRSSGVEAVSVLGGTSAWVAQNRPVVTGPRANETAA